MFEIIDVKVQGFCKGVQRAIDQAMAAANHEKAEEPITVLGSLVHNRYVNETLEAQGLTVLEAKGKTRLELLDEIDAGTVIFTAHGVSQAVRQKAEDKGLKVIDASCPFVLATQRLIDQKLSEGYTILYCGKKGHPEAEGATQSRSPVYLIETEQDLPDSIEGPIFVTNQTTMSMLDLSWLFEAIQSRYPQAEFCNEICNATRVRQQAVLDLKGQNVDLLVVVGDPASNNTRKLAQIGQSIGIEKVVLVEQADRLDPSAFDGIQKAAITSGASTPGDIKNEVLEKMKDISAHQN